VPTASFLVVALASIFASQGCAAQSDGTDETSEDATARTQLTVCFGGRSLGDDPYQSGGNSEFGALCRAAPHLIHESRGTDAAYPFFRWNTNVDEAVNVVVQALDTNHDGVVTNTDADVDLNVIGYSWGGFNGRDLVAKIGTDHRFSPLRKHVARFIALDPYRTDDLVFAKSRIQVPANVGQYFEFRHTVAPKDDCSNIVDGIVGPFTGRTPLCTGSTECHDYDYSRDPKTAWVDHCAVPKAATPNVLAIFAGQPLPHAPPELVVTRD
jgi:hypothetical protein